MSRAPDPRPQVDVQTLCNLKTRNNKGAPTLLVVYNAHTPPAIVYEIDAIEKNLKPCIEYFDRTQPAKQRARTEPNITAARFLSDLFPDKKKRRRILEALVFVYFPDPAAAPCRPHSTCAARASSPAGRFSFPPGELASVAIEGGRLHINEMEGDNEENEEWPEEEEEYEEEDESESESEENNAKKGEAPPAQTTPVTPPPSQPPQSHNEWNI